MLYIFIIFCRTNQLIDNNDDVEQINPPPPPVIISSSSGSSNNYRGTRVDLPNSFLRVSC